MISGSIRAWSTQQHKFPSVFLYKNTTTGIFSITEVEAEITEPLLPLEQLCLALIGHLGNVTRIEVHAFSGISIDICMQTLEDLHDNGLIKIRNYEKSLLENNLKTIMTEIGNDWFTPHIKKLSQRKLLKQYELSEYGLKSINTLEKTVEQTRDLNVIVTGDPFYLFYDNFDIRTDGYEMIEMNTNLTKHLLGHAVKFSEYTGIKPLSIGSNTVYEGKEVSNSQFWITIEGAPDDDIDNARFRMFLSSRSFERWANPAWNGYLTELVSEIGSDHIKDFLIKAMSETWMMVDEVIEEGLSLSEDKLTWILEADLEMQKLIFNNMIDPIAKTESEIKLRLPNSSWKVVILLRLEPYDDLALKSLRNGRFHQIASRKGFTLEEGYLDYTEMMREWNKEVNRQEYLEVLETLVEYECLIERLPDIQHIVVDVDDLLSENRRDTQDWQFARLREVDTILEHNSVKKVRYLATDKIHGKIDETEALDEWISSDKLEIIDGDDGDIPESIEIARKSKAHYIGNKIMKKGKKHQEYSRSLEYFVTKKRIHIPGLEPFYDWQISNLFDKMYNVYYE